MLFLALQNLDSEIISDKQEMKGVTLADLTNQGAIPCFPPVVLTVLQETDYPRVAVLNQTGAEVAQFVGLLLPKKLFVGETVVTVPHRPEMDDKD